MTVIQMSGQELTRLRIMIDLADNRITIEAAAALMGLGRRPGFPVASCLQCRWRTGPDFRQACSPEQPPTWRDIPAHRSTEAFG
jgi:hypothetical protein